MALVIYPLVSIGGFYAPACQFHSTLCSDYFVRPKTDLQHVSRLWLTLKYTHSDFTPLHVLWSRGNFFFRWSNGERARTQSSFIHSFFIFWKMKKHTNTLWNMASKWTWTNYLRGTNEQIRDFSIWNKSSHALTEPNHKQYAHSIRENMKRFRRNNRCCSFFSRPSGRSSVFHRVVAPIYKFFNKMHI